MKIKCLGCGAKTGDENINYCRECGKKLPKRSFGNALGGLGTVLLFILVFVMCSLIVEMSFIGILAGRNEKINSAVSYYVKVLSNKASTEEDIENAMNNIENSVNGELVGFEKKILDNVNLLTLISGLLTILVLCLAMRIRRYDPAKTLRVRKVNPERILSFILFGAALNVVFSAVISVIPMSETMANEFSEQYSSMVGTDSMFVEILALVIVTPICEELVFRAVPMTRLRASFGRWGSILMSAVLFSAAHYAFNTGSVVSVCYAFVAGILFALIFDRFDSVIPGILCHAGFNVTALVPLEGEDGKIGFAVTAIAVVVLLFCGGSIFSSRPTFSDVVYDPDGIEPIDEEEEKIVNRVKEIRKSEEMPDRDELDSLGRSWEMKRRGIKIKTDDESKDGRNDDNNKTEE